MALPKLKEQNIQTYSFQGLELALKLNDNVFGPSSHATVYAEHLRIMSGQRVADIGTGTGILAIIAAKLGGIVTATDNQSAAVTLAKNNALMNKVIVEVIHGEYFATLSGTFDVIVANLPQTFIPEQIGRTLPLHVLNALDGGRCGNEKMLNFLDIASKYMNRDSRLYISVESETQYIITMQKIAEQFHARLVGVSNAALPSFIQQHLPYYLRLNEEGRIDIWSENGKWYNRQYFYELKMR